jgi:hypothetical protein
MHARFEKRIEDGLTKIAAACTKRRHEVGPIERRVGRLLGQNTRAAGLFDVRIHAAENGVAQIAWKKVEKWRAWAQLSEGAYVLRTNVTGWSDEELWRAYIQLTDAETAFRIQKSDLSLRPVWHQKEDRVLAHILVCFLAYVLWKFLGQLCQQAGLGNEPRRVLDELSELRAVDVVLPTQDGHEIRLLRDAAQRSPENPPRTPRPGTPRPSAKNRFVVEKPGLLPLRRNDLRQTLGKLG